MLRFFSRFQRSRNAVLLLFCGILLIGLVAFYIPSLPIPGLPGRAPSSEDNTVVAKVGPYDISLKEMKDRMTALGTRYSRGSPLPPSLYRSLGLDQQALDALIEERVVLLTANDLSLNATDREVSDQIIRLPQFTDSETGKFVGMDEYRRRLQLSGQDLVEFERNIRQAITVSKVREYVGSSAQVGDREVEESFRKDNTAVDLAYAIIDPSKVRSKLKFADEELRSYYDADTAEFKAAQPLRKVEYIFIPTDEVAKSIKLTDEELRSEYETNKQTEKRISIVKLDVLTTQDEPVVNAKINDLNRRIRGGGEATPADFAEVARGNSSDPSASKGGDLGWIRKDANKPTEWKQRVFTNSLKVGDIDGPFREGKSWYIMKVTEERDVPFEQMRDTLVAGARNRRSYTRASELADKAYEQFTANKDIHKTAEEIAAEIKVPAASLIRTTPFFKSGDTLPEIGSNPQFEGAVDTLKKGEIGDKVGVPNGLAVPRMLDIRESGEQLTFDDAKFQVEQKLRTEREPDLALKRAQEIAATAKDADDFQRMLKAEGVEIKNDTNFNTYSFPGAASNGLQVANQARTAASNLKAGEVSRSPIKVGPGYLVFAATKRTEPDLTKLATERQGVRNRLLNQNQQMAYDSFLKAARKKSQDSGKIKIYKDRIDNFFNLAAQTER
jgi:peptidyl-prolyl cis-trans isomerase D